MKLVLLGTGTSQGIPVIGCTCKVCTSADHRDHRMRTSAWLEWSGVHLMVDIGPDFRQQMLKFRVPRVDAVLITHHHNDHIAGLDDIRPFNFSQQSSIPIYGLASTLDSISKRFDYIFEEEKYPGAPELTLQTVAADSTLTIGDLCIETLLVHHGTLPILGFRFGPVVYLTDIKYLPDLVIDRIKNCDVLIINALHHNFHPSHLNLEEALLLIHRIQPGAAYLTHISHHMGLYQEVRAALPNGVHLGYDGLTIEL